MQDYAWEYISYILPSRAPPSRLFGPVRTVLYILIAISYGYMFIKIIQKKLPRYIGLILIINLIANFLFTYLRFTQANLLLWFIDILIVWITIVASIVTMRNRIRRIAYMQIPYLLRVSFASILALRIFIHNI